MLYGESAFRGHATTIGGRRRRQQRQRWATIRFPFRKRGSRSRDAVNFVVAIAFGIMLVFMIFETTDHRLGRGTCCFLTGVAALTTAQRRAIVLSKIRNGMLLSQEANHNVTAAEEACRVWESILSRPSVVSSSSSIITQDVLSLSKTLYASCLVRVGRDGEAVSVYDSCLNTNDNSQKEGIAATGSSSHDAIKWRLAKARCLQRLLKYSDAAEEFSRVVADAERKDNENNNEKSEEEEQDQARMGAATCILRSTGDVPRARKILAEVSTSTRADSSSSESRAMLPSDALLLSSCLDYLESGNDDLAMNRLQEVLGDDALDASNIKSTSTTSFLLYRWILSTLKRNHRHNNKSSKNEESTSPQASKERTTAATSTMIDPNDLFMELIRINTSPLDDPDLLRLDDKIELHNLLTTIVEGCPRTAGELSSSSPPSSLASYWPDGLVLPAQSSEWKGMTGRHYRDDDADSSSLWIAKSRAGYGSHGNRILTLAEASEEINRGIDDDETDKPARKEIQIKTEIETGTEPYLLQRMIDPLMLLKGYKFSLRIYVVYFSSDEAYISSKGLVKLASEPLLLVDDDDDDESSGDGKSASKNHRFADASMHMTNSGRETVMQQEDLEYLWSEMGSNAEKEELWKDICRASAETLLLRYPERIASLDHTELDSKVDSNRVFREQKSAWKTRRDHWGIPKILGLDFVVQQQDAAAKKKQPWLVEVNRFPGLEPRDEDDRKIKYRIVRDAWRKASERLATTRIVPTKDDGDEGGGGDRGEDRHALFWDGALFESLSCGERDSAESSLERLQLETRG